MIKKMNIFIKFIVLSGIIFFSIINTVNVCSSVTMSEYSATPPFMASTVPPAVLILLDNSGSMNEFAYKTVYGWGPSYSSYPDLSFNPATTYYGYFDSSKKYSYAITAGGHFYQDAAGGWDGNFLNWLTMRRVDVVKKVLVGGKATPRSGGVPNYLSVDSSDRDFYKKYAVASTYAPFSGTRCFQIGVSPSTAIKVSTSATGLCSSFTAGSYNIKVKYSDTNEPLGVVQATWDKVRYGLMNFNTYGAKYENNSMMDGSAVVDNILTNPGVNVNLRTHIENMAPQTWTPLGESLYEATRYFRALMSAYGGGNYAAQDPVTTTCQKNFVIILTDGEATKDRNLPGTCFTGYGSAVTDSQGFNVQTWMDSIATNEGYASQKCTNANTMGGTYYLEGVSYWSHITDLRDGTGGTPNTSGTQNLTVYTVFAFDDSAVGRDLLKKSAKYGGFKDSNGNNKPDLTSEWDKDSNTIPDNYYEAQDGAALESSLISAVTDILKRTSSGTSVSVLTTSASGAGNIFQSYFLPSKTVNNKDITWLGYLLSLNVDSRGQIRDKTNTCIKFVFNESEGQTYVQTVTEDAKNNCESTVTSSTPLTSWTGYNWDAGEKLLTKTPVSRTIKTFVDANKNGFVDSGEYMDFVDTNKTTLRPYLRAAADTESANIINFIRGSSITGYRDRTCCGTGTNQYKLGDIVYSTPSVVSSPAENYGFTYGDKIYSQFFDSNKSRDTVTYIGTNDGMLHAICAKESGCTGGIAWGEELWAYIPKNLLPHLKWLTAPDYLHVYYVDLRAKITDINFSDMVTNGWKTVLIGAMRLGGGQISVTDNFGSGSETRSFQSSYFAIDITNPSNPTLLWEFTDTNLGFTSSYPVIAKVGNKWFVIIGSGSKSSYPPDYGGVSDRGGRIYVLDARNTGAWTLNTNYWVFDKDVDNNNLFGAYNGFMGDPISLDIDFKYNNSVTGDTISTSYNTEVVYIGGTYDRVTPSPRWRGKLFRLVLNGDINPGNWKLYTLFNGDSFSQATPIITTPTASTDENQNLWVYFGAGRFYSDSDKTTLDKHIFIGIRESYWDEGVTKDDKWKPCWDKNNNTWKVLEPECTGGINGITLPTSLYNSANVSSVIEGATGNVSFTAASNTCKSFTGSTEWNTFITNLSKESACRGWYNEFPAGSTAAGAERVLTKPTAIGGVVIFTSFIPESDICKYGGNSNLYSLYYKTGTAYNKYTLGYKEGGTTYTGTPKDAQGNVIHGKEVARVISLGTGMASTPAVHVGHQEGGTATIIYQDSTGKIGRVDFDLPLPRSGVLSWREL